MNNNQNPLSSHQQLDAAIVGLFKALTVPKEQRSSWEAHAQSVAAAGLAWRHVHAQLDEIVRAAEARGRAEARARRRR